MDSSAKDSREGSYVSAEGKTDKARRFSGQPFLFVVKTKSHGTKDYCALSSNSNKLSNFDSASPL